VTRILLADDQEIFRCALGKLLGERNSSMEVVGLAADGRELVRLARELTPDIVLMDPVMAGLNGMDAVGQMLEETLSLRIIIFTMQSDPRHVDQAMTRGARGYLLKNSTVAELSAAIEAVVAGKTYLSPAVAELVGRKRDYRTGTGSDSNENSCSHLSPREREVLQLLAEGNTSKEIAASLYIGVKTVETHRSQIMTKLNLRSIAELTKYAVRAGLTSL
jgi:DNA-binding NarL/FixJ family response regulator